MGLFDDVVNEELAKNKEKENAREREHNLQMQIQQDEEDFKRLLVPFVEESLDEYPSAAEKLRPGMEITLEGFHISRKRRVWTVFTVSGRDYSKYQAAFWIDARGTCYIESGHVYSGYDETKYFHKAIPKQDAIEILVQSLIDYVKRSIGPFYEPSFSDHRFKLDDDLVEVYNALKSGNYEKAVQRRFVKGDFQQHSRFRSAVLFHCVMLKYVLE